jgi:hypothetical protein
MTKQTPSHWQAETPILVEALAVAAHTTIPDVIEHLDANATTYRPDVVAVIRFVNEFVAAG